MAKQRNNLTVLILFRGDSIRRLYNLIGVVKSIYCIKGITIYVREADCLNHHIVERLLPSDVKYEFIEDKDSILHKTKHFNEMLRNVVTTYVGIWDADVVAFPEAIEECMEKLFLGEAKMVLPYNGICLDTTDSIADIYMRDCDFTVLDKLSYLMARLQPHRLTGGAVMMKKATFEALGGENEKYYGWGDDDFDRYIRFYNANIPIFRSEHPLFHLSHPRGGNSRFQSLLGAMSSKMELMKTINCRR